MTPIAPRCGQCLRPLGVIDLDAGDGRCVICRLKAEPVEAFTVVAMHTDRGAIAMEQMESRTLANRVFHAWSRSKMPDVIVRVIEPAAKAASLLAR